MRIFISLILSIIVSNLGFSQCNGRYDTEIFNSIGDSTITYSDVYLDNAHAMDVYSPNGDTATNRPLIIYMHAGAFTGGNKGMIDCVDFCTAFAKRGYITASINYRLANAITFLFDQDEQYKTVLKAVADAKAAVRFFRKSFANGNPYGIDTNAIYVAGYSSGGVTAAHQAFIDELTDLPPNVQALASVIGGTLEGDAGNFGYSSKVHGVISVAGGIHDINWIDVNDEPIVSAQGTLDNTINYNCGPGLNNPLVLTLCGAGEIHPQANTVGILNDVLIFPNTDHAWAAVGNSNIKFVQAIDFFSDFLLNILPCNQSTTNINESKLGLNIYPNPVKKRLYIESDYPLDLIMYNMFGQIVLTKPEVYNESILVTPFKKGIYFIRDLNTYEYRKIVIQ